MDEKDRLIIKAHSALMSTKAVLDRILREDDDAILSARVIGDDAGEDDAMNTETQQPEETPIQRLRRETFAKIAGLSYKRTPAEAEAFFNELTWMETPGFRRTKIEEFFGNPRYFPYPSLNRAMLVSEEMQERVENLEMIIALIENLNRHDKSTDLNWRFKEVKQMREQHLRRRETPIATIRRCAFAQVAELTGKPTKLIATVYEALDWNDQHVDRTEFEGLTLGERSIGPRARREQLIYENLTPEPQYPSSVTEREQRARKRRDRRPIDLSNQERAFMLQQQDARELMTKAVYAMFLNMRAEIARWHIEQSKKNARKSDLQRQIMRAQAEYERLTAA